jgi:hypothetical protein
MPKDPQVGRAKDLRLRREFDAVMRDRDAADLGCDAVEPVSGAACNRDPAP